MRAACSFVTCPVQSSWTHPGSCLDANSKHEQTHLCLACEALTVLGSCSEHQAHRWETTPPPPPPHTHTPHPEVRTGPSWTPVGGAEDGRESCWATVTSVVPTLRKHQPARFKSFVSLSVFLLTLDIITHTLHHPAFFSAPVEADIQSSHNFFLPSSCLHGWKTFSSRPWTHSGAHQLFPFKTDCLLLSVTIVGITSAKKKSPKLINNNQNGSISIKMRLCVSSLLDRPQKKGKNGNEGMHYNDFLKTLCGGQDFSQALLCLDCWGRFLGEVMDETLGYKVGSLDSVGAGTTQIQNQ